METIAFLNEQGELQNSSSHQIADQVLVKGYRTMVLTRLVDERMVTLQRQGQITFALSALGEEACAVASAAALEPSDWMYPQYREAGILFWRGFTVQQYVHHMFCDEADLIKGRQMPNHFGCRELNVVQVSSPIGTKIPHAAGCAWAMKYQKEPSVAIAYFGEGATSEGDFHVGLNFAAVHKVPAIFFCRNNGYAISTPSSHQFASDGIAPKGAGYGMNAFRVDGNDFFAVHQVVAEARKQCVSGVGPVLIEAITYRLGPHSTADDPTQYREDAEVKRWEAKCPILRLRRFLEKKGLWDDKKEEEWQETVLEEIKSAVMLAQKTAKPKLHSLIENVYFEPTPLLKEQYDQLIKRRERR